MCLGSHLNIHKWHQFYLFTDGSKMNLITNNIFIATIIIVGFTCHFHYFPIIIEWQCHFLTFPWVILNVYLENIIISVGMKWRVKSPHREIDLILKLAARRRKSSSKIYENKENEQFWFMKRCLLRIFNE